jgi:calpain-15
MVLEKVWAKTHGSYLEITNGHSYEVYRDLLGAPSFYYKTNIDNVWDLLEDAEQKNYICSVTAMSLEFEKDKLEKYGICGSQTYSMLRTAVVDVDGAQRKLLKLRNPLGGAETQAKADDESKAGKPKFIEWTGDWSDKSELWTPELRR